MLVALLQLNTTAGDIERNAALIMRGVGDAHRQGAQLIVTPELALMGYMPRDLLMNSGFIAHAYARAELMAKDLASAPPVLVGTATENSGPAGRPLFNGALLLSGGRIQQAFSRRFCRLMMCSTKTVTLNLHEGRKFWRSTIGKLELPFARMPGMTLNSGHGGDIGKTQSRLWQSLELKHS